MTGLTSLPFRGAFLEEGADAFSSVFGVLDAVEGSAGQSPAEFITAGRPFVDGLERLLNREGRILHDAAREF